MVWGYDHEYLLPHGVLARALCGIAEVWPKLILECGRNPTLNIDNFDAKNLNEMGTGFVLYASENDRLRFHHEGGFVADDGTSPIDVWIFGWDANVVHVDFVWGAKSDSAFSVQIQSIITKAIGDLVIRELTATHRQTYEIPVPIDWAQKTWNEVVLLNSSSRETLGDIEWQQDSTSGQTLVSIGASTQSPSDNEVNAFLCLLRKVVALWYVAVYDTDNRGPISRPPGTPSVANGVLQFSHLNQLGIWIPTEIPVASKNSQVPIKPSKAKKKSTSTR